MATNDTARAALSELGAAAVAYAERGLAVFPLKPRSKLPRTKNGFKNATTRTELVAGWWAVSPDSNIGIRCGQASKLIAIDLDSKHDGERRFAELAAQRGAEVPGTTTVKTGGGGVHLLFRPPAGVAVASRVIEAGIELKAEGTYIVAPPSLHENGTEYQLVNGVPVAALPAWLLEVDPERQTAPTVAETIPEGERDTTLTSLAGTMRRRGMGEAEILAALEVTNRERCRPPLPDNDVERIVRSVCRYEP